QAQSNPLFTEFTSTPHGTPPFDKISDAHYVPAIERGIALGRENVERIVNNPEAPTFDNTIAALENVNLDLDRALGVFYPLAESLSNDTIMEISTKISPMVSEYSTSINLNEGLWKRVQAVHDNTDTTALTGEQKMLLRETYQSFVRNGALLQGANREKYAKLQSRLSELTTLFGQNVLRELNTYKIWLTADDLAGLTESSIEAAAQAAREEGRPGEYLFTLDAPVYMAFMKNSDRRDLREKMYRLYSSRNTSGQYSNTEILKEIAATRLAIAKLLGYKTYADYALANKMAKNPANVYSLLHSLRDAYRPAQIAEIKEITDFASQLEGKPVELKPWDYSYYSNKLRNARYSYDEEEMRPYFKLDNVIDGVFGLATKLYGVTFEKNT
ncbi:MAG: peptidase M3, partial [Duncaniella sp.]|nr:peptidase M3 [Duncaniella sp.]